MSLMERLDPPWPFDSDPACFKYPEPALFSTARISHVALFLPDR